MIRVVVVDDEVLVRGGFQLILNLAPDIDVVATADGPRALDVIALHHPDVVLLDIRMPGKDGLSILHELRAAPERPVVAMLTTFDSDEYIATALRNGAAGFLLKDTDPEQLPLLRAHPARRGGRPLTDRERRGGRQVSERRRRSGGAGPWSPC
jgi:DNA-binding NarL/FixJ family response regulator